MRNRVRASQSTEAAFWGWTAAAALANVFMLEAMRLFIGYLVFVVDQSQRGQIAAIVLAVFLLPLVAIPLARLRDGVRLARSSLILIALGRLGVLIIEEPVTRIVLAILMLAGWSWFTVSLLATQRRMVAFGLTFGLGLDLGIRLALSGNYLALSGGSISQVASLILIVAVVVSFLRLPAIEPVSAGNIRNLLPVAAIGPGLALFHIAAGAPAFAEVKVEIEPALAALLMTAGVTLGLGIGSLRTYALSRSQSGTLLALRFIIFDIGIGGFALWTVWSETELRLLGIIFLVATTLELLLFTLIPTSVGGSISVTAAATAVTAAMLLQFAILFPYYIASSSGWVLALAWLLLGLGALGNTLLPRQQIRWPQIQVRQFAPPVIAVVLVLLLATGWQLANEETSSGAVLEPEFTVIVFNIQSGFTREKEWDLEPAARVIEESGADVVLLQEVGRGWLANAGNDQLRWLQKRLDLQGVWGPSSDDGLWGNAILSRGSVADDFHLRFETTQNLKRSAVGALIETERGLVIVISTHLDNPTAAGATRDAQVTQLLELWDGRNPTIIGGDFNADPDSPVIQRITDAGLVDSGDELPPNAATTQSGRRIDYIFYSEHYELRSVEVIDTEASDHLPVLATFEIIDRR